MTVQLNEFWKESWSQTMDYQKMSDDLYDSLTNETINLEEKIWKVKDLQSQRLRALRDDMIERKRALEETRSTEIEKRKTEMENCKYGSVVKFDVGGRLFDVVPTDLSRTESLLRLMLSDAIPSCIYDGVFFIDRDGTNFHLILEYIQYGKEYLLNEIGKYSELDLYNIAEEMKFYGLKEGNEIILQNLGLITLTYGENLLNSVVTGGSLRVVQYIYHSGASGYNEGTPLGGEGDSWQNNGMFINQSPYKNSEELSYRTNTNTGTTWNNNGQPGVSVGVVVIDITSNSQKVEISKFCAWQMISDGCCTDIKISFHQSDSDTYPRYDSGNWEVILEEKIGAGERVPVTELDQVLASDSVNRVTGTWHIPTISTRYLKIECKNDGACGTASYIELRQLRAFSF